MKGRSFWLLPALLIVLSVAALKAEIRTWTDDTGKHKTQAEYVSYAKGQVTLRRSDGREVTLPLTRLSKEDKVYVRERVRQELDEKAKAEKEAKEDSADREPAMNRRPSVEGAASRRTSTKTLWWPKIDLRSHPPRKLSRKPTDVAPARIAARADAGCGQQHPQFRAGSGLSYRDAQQSQANRYGAVALRVAKGAVPAVVFHWPARSVRLKLARCDPALLGGEQPLSPVPPE